MFVRVARFIGIYSVLSLTLAFPLSVFAMTSNDPLVSQWAFEKTKVYEAWELQTGSRDVVVAVIDNGFDSLHPDIRGNVWQNTDEIAGNKKDDDKNGYIDDVWGWNFISEDTNGDGDISAIEKKGNNDPRPNATGGNSEDPRATIHHGTVVAGLIGAIGNNETYGSGVAWRVRLMNVKVASNGGIGVLSDLPLAIRYAVDNGADIINLSLVGFTYPDQLTELLRYAKEKGVLVVAASGNNASDLTDGLAYPVCADGNKDEQLVLGVTAVQSDRRLARFSNIGGGCIDIAAPGVSISSTMRFSPKNGFEEGYGGNWNGTSFAAPIVSGAAALVKSVNKNLTGVDIRRILLSSTNKTPTDDEVVYAKLFGAGFLDVVSAVRKAIAEKQITKSNKTVLIDQLGSVYEGVGEALTFVTSSSRLRNADDVAQFQSASGTLFASTKFANNRVVVSLFASDWTLLTSFSKPLSVPQRIVLADMNYDGDMDVILSPMITGDRAVFREYNKNGKLRRTVLPQMGVLQSGASVVVQRQNDINTLFALYTSDSGTYIDTMGEEGGWTASFKEDAIGGMPTELLVSTVSTSPQFVTVATTNDGSYVTTYDTTGAVVKKTNTLSSLRSPVFSSVGGQQNIVSISGQEGVVRAYTYPTIKRDKLFTKEYVKKTATSVPAHILFVAQ